MDEFLEFDAKIQEALREPMESGKILVSRAGDSREFPARFLLLATTNLCPCGRLVPEPKNKCRCRTIKKRQYIEKLSGPILDRFAVVSLSHEYSQSHTVALSEIQKRVDAARRFAQDSRGQCVPNSRIHDGLGETLSDSVKKKFPFNLKSLRRLKSVLQVARSIADLEKSEFIQLQHLNEALGLSHRAVEKLQVDLERFL